MEKDYLIIDKYIFSNSENLAKLYFLMSILPLAAALISQYFFKLHPCELCIYQRIPYVVVIFFSFLTIIWKNLRIFLTSSVIIINAFFANAAIAFYHFGVENHWWVFGDCRGNFDMSSIESLKKSLLQAPIVHCDEVQFSFLGISMAGWNFIYCLLAGIFLVYAIFKFIKLGCVDI